MFRCRLFPGQSSQGYMDESNSSRSRDQVMVNRSVEPATGRMPKKGSVRARRRSSACSGQCARCRFGSATARTNGYMNRTLPALDQMEKIALLIPTEPARKKLGFSGVGFSNGSEEDDLIAQME
jgi:hypothetical protein